MKLSLGDKDAITITLTVKQLLTLRYTLNRGKEDLLAACEAHKAIKSVQLSSISAAFAKAELLCDSLENAVHKLLSASSNDPAVLPIMLQTVGKLAGSN